MIEVIIAGAVWGVAQRLGNRWLDEAAEGLDAELKRLMRRLLPQRGDSSPNDPEKAQAELADYIRRNPESGAQVVAAAMNAEAAETRVRRMTAFLDMAFALIAGLRRPVFLPGFFNSALCVTVIDARTERGKVSPLYVPEPRSWEDPETATIYFENAEAFSASWARLWLIPVATEARRDEIIGLLNDNYARHPLDPIAFRTSMILAPEGIEKSETPLDVETIDRDRIGVPDLYAPPSLDEAWYLIRDVDGIELFVAALAHVVKAEIEHEQRLTTAINPQRLATLSGNDRT